MPYTHCLIKTKELVVLYVNEYMNDKDEQQCQCLVKLNIVGTIMRKWILITPLV